MSDPTASVVQTPGPRKRWPGALLLILFVAIGAGASAGLWSLTRSPEVAAPQPVDEPAWRADAQSPAYTLSQEAEGPKILDAHGGPIAGLGLGWWGDYGRADGEAGCAADCVVSERRQMGPWEHTHVGGDHTLRAIHTGALSRVEATWTIREGDPRVSLKVAVEYLEDAWPDREAVELELFDRPAALGRDLRFAAIDVQHKAVSDRWTPHRVIAGAGDRALQLTAWGFEAMEVTGTATGGRVSLEIDDARNHPFRPMADCATPEGALERAAQDRRARKKGDRLDLQAELWIGHTWGPMLSRLPAGRQAALALIDDGPAPEARKLAAILWGHSDPTDPRYGNGGLLSHELTMTRSIPSGGGDEALAELIKNVSEMGVRVAAQSLPGEGAKLGHAVLLDRFKGCDDFHGKGWRAGALPEDLAYVWSGMTPEADRDDLNMLRPGQRALRTPILWSHNRASRPLAFFHTLNLAAGRTRLLGQQLTQANLDRLVKERGILAARVELDTVSGSAEAQKLDGMIVAQDEGHFATTGDLETRLFEMKQLVETGDLWIAGLEDLAGRLQALDHVRVRPLADGRLRIKNAGEGNIEALTIGLPGSGYAVELKGQALAAQRDVQLPRGQRETWIWFDLPAGAEVTLTVNDDRGYRLQPLIPVRWSFADKARAAL